MSQSVFAAAQLQTRLNETLKVRHSFAHGTPLPAVGWLQTQTGRVQISKKAVSDTNALFDHLVARTDRSLANYIQTAYLLSVPW